MKVTADEVLELVFGIHSNKEDFEEGDLVDRVQKVDSYELTTVCPQLIEPEWAISEDKLERYTKLDPKTCPPVVIIKHSEDDYEIVDGTHRIEAFRQLGITSIPCYLGIIKS